MTFHLTETQYGFEWGPALVERAISDRRIGVVLFLKTTKFPHGVQIRVSDAGNVWVNNQRVANIAEKPE